MLQYVMTLNDLVTISGKGGLFKMIGSQKGGIIAEDLQDGKRQFYSMRSYQFSPLASIGIYTYEDVLPLPEVFKIMKENPPLDDFDKLEMRAYIKQIIPNYDEEKVYISDIKKLISWYFFLQEKDLFDALLAENADSEQE